MNNCDCYLCCLFALLQLIYKLKGNECERVLSASIFYSTKNPFIFTHIKIGTCILETSKFDFC